jgi:predicted ATPase
VTLITNNWDDYGFKTTFDAAFLGPNREVIELGLVKILQRGQQITRLDNQFGELSDDFCSLGGTADYYRALSLIDRSIAKTILKALRDVAANRLVYEEFRNEPGFELSLLRFQGARDALREGTKRFRRVKLAVQQEFAFTFRSHLMGFQAPHELSLRFSRTRPLARTAVLIGANGTGKTSVLGRLAYALIGLIDIQRETLEPPPPLAGGVLALSWSAFDRFEIPRGKLPTRYAYRGLRVFDAPDKDPSSSDRIGMHGRGRYERLDLEHAIRQAARALLELPRRDRVGLRDAFLTLRLGDSELCTRVAAASDEETFADALHRFSAGQKLVVCTLIHLRALLAPGTMVLFDEPEAHLHPALLSGLVRELNGLLAKRDSFAIVATHSPLVLQEVPAQQVVILNAEKGIPRCRTYAGETFGETISFLMDEVFQVGGEQRNWRAIIDSYRQQGHLDDLKRSLREDLNLPLAGFFATDPDGERE